MQRDESYSIFLAGNLLPQLRSFLATRRTKGAVEVNGKKWAASYRFVFPSEPMWRGAFSAAAQRYFDAPTVIQRAEITAYGIYTPGVYAPPTGFQYSTPDMGSGVGIIRHPAIEKSTDCIPMKLGTTFGIWYVIHGKQGGHDSQLPLVKRITFPSPGLRDPKTGRL